MNPLRKESCDEEIAIHGRADSAFALKQVELCTPVAEVCRKMGVSDARLYNWRKKYGGLGPSELKRLKMLEAENARLKRMVADLSLDKAMLQEVLSKKALKPSRKRELVDELQLRYGASQRQACQALKLSRSVYRYKSIARDSSAIRMRMREITETYVHYGFPRVLITLRREDWRLGIGGRGGTNRRCCASRGRWRAIQTRSGVWISYPTRCSMANGCAC